MSGTLKLAAKGVLDEWMTGNPQISYFLTNFKRHSKFSMEQIELPFSGTIDFGNEIFCEIPYSKGDLLRNLALRITLNDIQDSNNPETVKGYMKNYQQTINLPYVPSLCSELVEHAELYIGGQLIERITGEYIYMYQQLNNSYGDVSRSLKKTCGHGGFLDNYDDDALDDVYHIVGPSLDSYDEDTYNTYILDLPFYFYRQTNLSIPMCALTKQRISLKIKLRPFSEIVFGGVGSDMKATLRNVSLESTFGFLDNPERNYLMTRPVEYVITQLQLAQFNMKYPESKKSVLLNFKNPVKEMFFIVQNDAYKQFNNSLRFQEIKKVQLRFNNQLAVDADHELLVYNNAVQNHMNIPFQGTISYRYKHNEFIDYDISSEFGSHSFAFEPKKTYPTGQVNMSRIAHQHFTIEIDPEVYNVYAPKVYQHVGTITEASEGDYPIVLRFATGRLSPGRKAYVKSKDNKVRVYALSYNILRVSGGIGGLKF